MNKVFVTLLIFISEISNYDITALLHRFDKTPTTSTKEGTASFWVGKTLVYIVAHGIIWIISLSAGSAAHIVATALTLAWAKPIEIASDLIMKAK